MKFFVQDGFLNKTCMGIRRKIAFIAFLSSSCYSSSPFYFLVPTRLPTFSFYSPFVFHLLLLSVLSFSSPLPPPPTVLLLYFLLFLLSPLLLLLQLIFTSLSLGCTSKEVYWSTQDWNHGPVSHSKHEEELSGSVHHLVQRLLCILWPGAEPR